MNMAKMVKTIQNLPRDMILACINIYRKAISPRTLPSCRFTPSCSEYAQTAVQRYGATKGGWMAVKRIARCHPWHPGGYDPI